jgi:hypothetical protein
MDMIPPLSAAAIEGDGEMEGINLDVCTFVGCAISGQSKHQVSLLNVRYVACA